MAERQIDVSLIPEADIALQALIKRTGYDERIIVNHAIQLYAGIAAAQDADKSCPIRLREKNGKLVASW